MGKLNKEDLNLIETAKNIVTQNLDLYENKAMVVGCVIKAKSGNIYKGINIKTSHSVCAEQVALGQALANGEREFETIVAVKYNVDGSTRVVSPCGLCRYIFEKLQLNLNVIVEDIDKGEVLKVHSSKLLPYPYKRHKGEW